MLGLRFEPIGSVSGRDVRHVEDALTQGSRGSGRGASILLPPFLCSEQRDVSLQRLQLPFERELWRGVAARTVPRDSDSSGGEGAAIAESLSAIAASSARTGALLSASWPGNIEMLA